MGPRLTQRQKDFNFMLSSTRMIVENAFGALKNRFRRILHFTEQVHLPFVVDIIVCACILHNICIDQNDILDEIGSEDSSDEETDFENNNPNVIAGVNRRQRLVNELVTNGIL